MSVIDRLLGRRLANRDDIDRKLNAFEGLPAMGLDGLGSASYGPEAALSILIPIGSAAVNVIVPVMLPILVLLAVLYLSYRQTIRAYPNNGGAYIVARENLGTHASLVAAAALMIDYVLNVAVGISAGVGALTSALPALHPLTLWLCLGILLLVTLANLRGTIDAGRLFALPTYTFAVSFLLILAYGIYKTLTSAGEPGAVVAPAPLQAGTEAVGAWILLRAFAAGCTAMTGVEAVSNGVDAFKEPVTKRAHHTLGAICGILGLLLAGIAYLAHAYHVGAMDQTRDGYQSVLSQLAGAVVGRGALYYVAIGSVLCVLCLSANTSFVDFPRMCRLIAQDDFLPRPFAVVGRRLVFSVGIFFLATSAGILLAVFGGITDRLIPLFAIGAFLTFTLSQSGMVVHWLRQSRDDVSAPRYKHHARLVISALGATTTVVALGVIIVAKFMEGAWITLIAIPIVIVLLAMVKKYYRRLDAELRDDRAMAMGKIEPPLVLVAMERWNRLADEALRLALRLSPDVTAVHIAAPPPGINEQEELGELRRRWEAAIEGPACAAGLRPPQLILVQSPYRRLQGPLLQLIEKMKKEKPGRTIAVLVPVVVKRHWWQHLLHTHRASRLRNALLRFGGSRVAVVSLPWYLDEPVPEEGLEEQEKHEPIRPQRLG
jgi:amino acid transporter